MNKNKLPLALSLIMMITLSCEKEKHQPIHSKKGGSTADLRLSAEELEAVTNDFITQSLSENWSLGHYEFEDVTLMLEGALNYRTCTPHEYYDEIATDSTSFRLSIYQQENGKWLVDAERAIELWNRLLEHAEATGQRLENNEYFNIVADLEITHVNYEAEEVDIGVVIWAGLASAIPVYTCDYENTDSWWAISYHSPWNGSVCGSARGCGINSGSNTSCARREIMRRINSQFCYEICEASYYMNISFVLVDASSPYPSLCPPLPWSWTGFSLGNNTNECLDKYKMECYTLGIKNTGYTIASNSSKCFVSLNIMEMVPACPCPYTWFIYFYIGTPVLYNPN